MSTKKFTVNPGAEIIITVSGKTNSSNFSPPSTLAQNKRAMMPVRSEDESLPRRLKKGGFLNFYDFGQIKVDDSFQDLSLAFDAYNGSALPGNIPPTTGPFNWTALNSLILAVDPANWKTTFKKLEYEDAEKYGLDVAIGTNLLDPIILPVARNGSRLNTKGALVADSKWSDKGLKVDNTDSIRFISPSAFVDFMIGPYNPGGDTLKSDFRVTASVDPEAADVADFKINSGADIFLVPAPTPRVIVTQNPSDVPNLRMRILLAPFGIVSRSRWLNETLGRPFPILSYFNVNETVSHTLSSSLVAEYRALSGSHQYEWWDTGDNETNVYSNLDINALLYGSYQNFYQKLITNEFRTQLNLPFFTAYDPNGLVGAIQQNGNTYYVYPKSDLAIGTLELNALAFFTQKKWNLKLDI